ncbi:hypothetical protein K457DRAFT_12253 [Linnemannia elongata AG-77]|uniref:Amino acid permease/ SLC12A domain-containing protein n=1 Tax=Linnemannia elongata AG-77 TaxID=1314771 RepID=A0A197KFU2_9FUNG|nr:hypothetical protein K457DRAFT_12253 [Linnemannia elongata AG-77]
MPDPAPKPPQKLESAHLKGGGDIPLRPLPSMIMAQYRTNGSSPYTSDNSHSPNGRSGGGAGGGGSTIVRSAPSLLTLDDYNLISLGYKPVLSRSLNWLSQTGIALSSSNVLCGIITLYGLTLTNGGPAWATWSYLVIGIMSFIVSLCLAELASAYPTTGGVHHWVYELGSTRRRPFLTWMTGWLTVAGSVASASSVAFYFSSALGEILFIVHKIALTPGILVMFHLGAVLLWQSINLFPIRGFGYISVASGIYIVGVIVAFAIALLSHAQVEAGWIHVPFTTFLNYSGNPSAVYAAFSSTLMASFVFCPQDTVIRMSEESRRPEKVLPRLITMSSLFSLIMGFPIVLGLNYGILHPIKGLLDEAVPAVDVILMTLGRPLGITFVALILTGIFFTGLARLSIASRVAYSFARDGGLPKSSYWNHLQSRRKTPQRVSWLVTAACMSGIFPFYWGDGNAFHWIASLACVATNLSFGPFSLGSLSRFLHTLSILWLIFLSAVLMLPMTFPVTISNFNYTSAAVAGIVVLSGLSWWVNARFRFSGAAKDGSRAVRRIPGSPKYQQSFESSVYGGGGRSNGGPGNGYQGQQQQQRQRQNSPSLSPETPRFLGGTLTPPSPHPHLQAHQPQPRLHHSMSPGVPRYAGGIQRDRQSSFTRHSGTNRRPADPVSSSDSNFGGGGGGARRPSKTRTAATTVTANSRATTRGGENGRNSGRVSRNPSTNASRSQISLQNPVHTSTTHSSSHLPSSPGLEVRETEGGSKDDHLVTSILGMMSDSLEMLPRDREDLHKTTNTNTNTIASSSLSPSSQPSPSHSKTTSSVTPEEGDLLRHLTNSSNLSARSSLSPVQVPGLPEISIAPPSTISSLESQSQTSFATSTSSDVHIVHEDTIPQAYDRHDYHHHSQRQPGATSPSAQTQTQTQTQTQMRPFNATESIFPNLAQNHNVNNSTAAPLSNGRITIDNHQQQNHLRSTTEPPRRRPPSPFPRLHLTSDFTATEDTSSCYSTPQRTPTNTTHTHSKQPSFNNSSSEQEDNDNDIEHAVQSTIIRTRRPQPTPFRPPPPPTNPPPPLPLPLTSTSPTPQQPPNIRLETPALSEIIQEDPPTTLQTPIQKRAVVGNTDKVIDIMDVDDTFDEQYNPVISAYQSSHDLFKHFPAAAAPSTSTAVGGQQQQQQYQQQQQQQPRSLPPPPRRRYPVPVSPTSPNGNTGRTHNNLPPLSSFEDKTFTSRPLRGKQLLSPISPTGGTTPTTNISNDRNSGAGSDIEVDPEEKEASIVRWAQEQAAIEEHRLEKLRRSKVRAQLKDKFRNTDGLAENGVVDTSIRPMNFTLKSHRTSLLDADSDDDYDNENPTTTTHHKTSTFGLSDIHQSSTPLKVLLEKDDDDDNDEESQTAAK